MPLPYTTWVLLVGIDSILTSIHCCFLEHVLGLSYCFSPQSKGCILDNFMFLLNKMLTDLLKKFGCCC